MPFAHVKWFVETGHSHTEPLTNGEWALVAGGVLLGVALLACAHMLLIRSGITRRLDSLLGRYGKLIPYIVRYTTGLLFIINAAKGLLFAPNVPTDAHAIAPVLSVVLAVVGVMLIIGFRVRVAGAAILGVYAMALLLVRPLGDILDHVEYIGIGLYLLLHGSRSYLARARMALWRPVLSPESLLRIFVGIGLMTLALTEKLIGVELSTGFLAQHHWNFLHGLGVSDRAFIIVSGITEFVVGLTLVLNIAPRLTTAVVAGLMTITAILLGVEEVFGHLFALSLVAVVWLRNELLALPAKKARPKRHA